MAEVPVPPVQQRVRDRALRRGCLGRPLRVGVHVRVAHRVLEPHDRSLAR